MSESNPGLPPDPTCCCREAVPETRLCASEESKPSIEPLASPEHELQLLHRELQQQGQALLQTQQELLTAREHYRRLYEETPLGHLTLDAQGWIGALNGTAAALLGAPATALLGRPLAIFFAAADRHRFLSHLRAALQMRCETACELRLAGETCTERIVRLGFLPPSPAPESSPESPLQLQVTLSDQTALKQAEAALRQSEARFRVTFDSAGVGVAHIALDGSWLFVNPRFAEIVGYSEAELQQRTFHALTHREDLSVHLGYFTAMAHGTLRGYSQEKRLRHREGHAVWVEATAVLQRDCHGLPHYSVHVIQDISERKQAEAHLKALAESLEQRAAERAALAERRAEQLQTLAAELTATEQRERRRLAQLLHDHLQQHLVAIRLKLHGLCRRTEDAAFLERLQELDVLVNESLDTSRGLTYELSPPILHEGGLKAALDWLAGSTERKHGLSVEVVASCSAESIDQTQRVLLFHSVRELLFNVVKHTQTSQARVEVSESGDQIQVVVSDQGIGFDPAHPEHPDPCVSGFGLFNIRERLEWLGGQLQVESAPGQGTRVTVQLPRDTASRDTERATRLREF